MIDLNARQRMALLAGLELLREQIERRGKASHGGRALSPNQLRKLAAIVSGNPAAATASHRHAPDGHRVRSYDVAGECSSHGSICVGCEVVWHLEDGPLAWCRECDRVLNEAGDPGQSTREKRQPRRRRGR